MGLLSIFQRNKQTSAKPAKGRGGKSPARQAPLASTQNPVDTAEAVREARARARTRLMGATVLLLVGVIGFPLLFEAQPRPIPVDLPIEIPARNAPGVVDGARAGAHPSATPASASVAPSLSASVVRPESVSYDARPSAPVAASEPASTPAKRSTFASLAAAFTSSGAASEASPAPSVPSAAVAQAKAASRPGKPAPASAAYLAPARPAAASHVTPPPVLPPAPSPAAILAGAPTSSPKASESGAGRFVVQVGAFLEDAKVRDARTKVEKLGLKTYTQPVDTPTGKRIRVRIGPYPTKAEADKVAARIKAEGQTAVVLAL